MYLKIKHTIPVIIIMLIVSMALSATKITRAEAPQSVPGGLLFSFHAPDAVKVYLAGDFNHWGNNKSGVITNPDYLMQKGDNGVWFKEIATKSPVVHYKYVVVNESGDSKWHADPNVVEKDIDGNSLYSEFNKARKGKNTNFDIDFLHLQFYTDAGKIQIGLFDKNKQISDILQVPEVILDGVPQTGFQTITTQNRIQLENKTLRVNFEKMSEKSLAVTWTTLDKKTHSFELRVTDNSSYYGGGERFNSINQKGYILKMASIDHPEDKGSISYKPVPFYMSTRGYGLWVDSFYPGIIDFNATERANCIFRYSEDKLRVVFIDGPDMPTILKEFTGMAGRTPIPPAWAFAPWKSRDVHKNRNEVLQDAEGSRKYHLPCSVIVLDSPWETGYNNFIINETQFENPSTMFARVEELGFYPCLWLTPFVNSRDIVDMKGIENGPSSNYAEAVAKGVLVKKSDGNVMISDWWKGEGGLVDFTNPKAVEWWYQQILQAKQWNVHAFKCDDGEGNFVQDAQFYDGTPAEKMKTRYAVTYLDVMQKLIEKEFGGEGVLLARPGYTGTQKYPFCWSGDNMSDFSYENGLPGVIIAGQTASLSGIPLWGSDISGYEGTATKEVFIRWTQFGAFSPLMMVHMTSNLGPWDFDEETLNIYRKFALLHTQLFPYIYTAVHESSQTGMPIIRPMVLAFQTDPQAGKYPYQFLFGPDLLVAPIYQGGTYRTVYLPKGEWVDYWTGKAYKGGQVIEVNAPLDRMPLFVKEGAIIPMIPEDIDTLIPRSPKMSKDVSALDDRRILQIWPGKTGSMSTYDGISAHSESTGDQTSITLSSESRPLELHIMFQKIKDLKSSNQTPDNVIFDSERNVTICKWKSFSRKSVISWEKN